MQPTPRVTRRVAAASAPRRAIESGRGLARRPSPTQIESNSGLASTAPAMAIISSTEIAPKNTPRWGSVNPNVTFEGLMRCPPSSGGSARGVALLLEVPLHDGLHHQEVVLPLGQDQLGAGQAEVAGAHHPHERQVAGEQLLELRVDLHALGGVQGGPPGHDEAVHLGAAVSRAAG